MKVQVTSCPEVEHDQSVPDAAPGTMPAGKVSVNDNVWFSLPPRADSDGVAVYCTEVPATR